MKSKNKRFFKFVNRNDLADRIKLNPKVLKKPIKGDEAVLSKEEIDKLIDCNIDLQEKAIVETFIVSGARSQEIRKLKVGDVTIDTDMIYLYIDSAKNGDKRKIPIIAYKDNPVARYPKHLISWYNNH